MMTVIVAEQRVEEPFMLAVREELGDRFTISVEATYRLAIRFIVTTVVNEFRRCHHHQQQQQHCMSGPTTDEPVTAVTDDVNY